MDQKFQTSFIPKKQSLTMGGSLSSQRSGFHITSLFMVIAVLLFIVSLVGVGGAYSWKQYLLSSQDSYKNQLKERESQFNINLIEQLKQINVQIDTAKQLLKNHTALSQVFDILQQMTISNVRFISLDVSNSIGQNTVITMKGYGSDLSAVAFQSEVLGKLSQYGLKKIVKNPMISDPVMETGGAAAFGFSATINHNDLTYNQLISPMDTASSTSE